MLKTTTLPAGVALSNPDRVLYPDQQLTKRDLATYYLAVADTILPYIKDRPLMVVRCPRGRQKQCFHQKHVNESIPEPIRSIEVEEQKGVHPCIAVSDTAGLIMLVQLGVLEIHPWGSRADRLDRPDRVVWDLDPGEGVAWSAVVEAAHTVRERLEKLGLRNFVRTTGGKGLHVFAPLARRSTWAGVKEFARDVADGMVRREPKRFVATSTKSERKGKIYVDYLRNDRGATAIASYSTRARPGAPVATPLRWEELLPELESRDFNAHTVPQRLESLGEDPWSEMFQLRQTLTRSMRLQARAAD